jgi:hypothetical protein
MGIGISFANRRIGVFDTLFKDASMVGHCHIFIMPRVELETRFSHHNIWSPQNHRPASLEYPCECLRLERSH